jgi:hypothetical protein
MSLDVEDLLRQGMERFAEHVPVPSGLAHRAARARRRRRLAIGAAAAAGTAAVTAIAVLAATGGAGAGGGATQARTTAYVVSRVEKALAGQHLVLRGRTTSDDWGSSIYWAYGSRNRFEEFTGSGEPFLAQGTALIGGKLTGVLVTYYNRKWSLLPEGAAPASACSRTGTLEMAGPAAPARNWPAFIHATLACGAATVTGHAWIGALKTVRITGSPVTEKLWPGEASAIHEKWLRSQWTLYVNPNTYLPVRLSASNYTYGGPMPSYYSTGVTDIRWLRPTAANIAKALVTLPPGFRHVRSPANQ